MLDGLSILYMFKQKIFVFFCILLIIFFTIIMGYYVKINYFDKQYVVNDIDQNIISVNLLIKYDSNNLVWYNNSYTNVGNSLFNLTNELFVVDYSESSLGTYVKSINSVSEIPNNVYWLWWSWDEDIGWIQGQVSSNQFILENNSTVAWYLQDPYEYDLLYD